MFLQFSCICSSKYDSKTLPKRGPNPSKIDAENVLIFNIDFLRFWLRFGRVVGLQDEPSCLQKILGPEDAASQEPSKVKGLEKIMSWRAPGSILDAPGLDFGGFGDDFSKFSKNSWHVASKMSLQYSLQKSLQRSLPCWSRRCA